jgi:hypothetical protein
LPSVAKDQRDYPRPSGLYKDISAVERYWQLFMTLIKKDNKIY